jgi:acyl-coenzyme A thioesterase PaaI-like protein
MLPRMNDELERKLSRWIPDSEPPSGPRAAQHRLAAAIREMNHLLLERDPSEEALLAMAEQAEAFVSGLAGSAEKEAFWGYAETSNAGNPRAMFDRSPVIGLGNPVSPPVRMWVDGDVVRAAGVFGRAYEGPPGHVHGGVVSLAFDEVLGLTQSLANISGMTGTLTVRYRKPTPLYREVTFRGTLEGVEGRKIFTRATLHAGETLCAEAEGIFIAVDMGKFERMARGEEA